MVISLYSCVCAIAHDGDVKEEVPLSIVTESELYDTAKDGIAGCCGLAFTVGGGARPEGAENILGFQAPIKGSREGAHQRRDSLLGAS